MVAFDVEVWKSDALNSRGKSYERTTQVIGPSKIILFVGLNFKV